MVFHIRMRNGLAFESREAFASECGYSLAYIARLRRKGLGWQAIWNRKRNGTPAQRAKQKRKALRSLRHESLFEPVSE
jgi:hypothetical protein